MKNHTSNNIGIAMKIYIASSWLYSHHLGVFSKLLYALNYVAFSSIIPPCVKIGKGTSIAHSMGVVMHHTAVVGENCHILHNVTLGGPGIIIGNNVLLGCGCVIQGPCKIGDNVKIGSNTFVNFDVPDGATVVGGGKGRIILDTSENNNI